ncbi:MAG TPA: ABC transporter ATP-binding protein/permease [Candidatus Eisenbergiella stercorigallinarum]|uniref:ABC transporter ATP-binding protein/permease n=1 Tax=Candidatus Eisenbergiella stercorigallinarum TaxID=2838557 RepID=A0A9D2U121_9FIRM|nr:ABC transporter ATP-binding protein/permease [Candidatus Eisenbergiella stercorigallinarum]
MKKHEILEIMKEPVLKNRAKFLALALILAGESALSLLLPQILSVYIDGIAGGKGAAAKIGSFLSTGGMENGMLSALALCAAGYCAAVLLKGAVSALNIRIGERLSWSMCDHLRVKLFGRIFSFDLQYHKMSAQGSFLERLEGDIGLLSGFFSSMMIDIAGSLLTVAGVLIAFWLSFPAFGLFFTVLSAGILLLFLKTQEPVARLWKRERDTENELLGDFSQSLAAYEDIAGLRKQDFVLDEMEKKFGTLEKQYEKAAFLGNLPSTAFYSLLNAAEAFVFFLGIYLIGTGRMTLGGLYLILSYAELLNTPFLYLKQEFANMPKVIAALRRIREVYEGKKTDGEEKAREPGLSVPEDNSIRFEGVSFGYRADAPVLREASFRIPGGSRVQIEGRTGSGKSTILQLVAGFCRPQAGTVRIGGRAISEYEENSFRQFLFYIQQSPPVLEDTVRNQLTGFDERFSDREIREALKKTGLAAWVDSLPQGLEERLRPAEVTADTAQLLAWTAAVLRKPGILLADEFDALIGEKTLSVIDGLMEREFAGTTILLVTHRKRSGIKADIRLTVDDGRKRDEEKNAVRQGCLVFQSGHSD